MKIKILDKRDNLVISENNKIVNNLGNSAWNNNYL